jgi:nucleoid-associated protein YgaU
MADLNINTLSNLSSSARPEKAYIQALDGDDKKEIRCLFNPNEYTFSKHNEWTETKVLGKNIPELKFAGGDSMKLTMQLFFDTYAIGEDVRKTTDRIWKLMIVNPILTDLTSHKGRPPKVMFHWGATWSFEAVISDISQKFTMFRHDGVPVRATLDVTFVQVQEKGKYPGQNPTTRGQPGYKQRVVNEGDTIDWIAHEEYGDSAQWRFIADTNHLDDPLKLKPGQVLAIPPQP